ncbi:MAG: hypothetical protein ACOYIE_05410 [Agathobaculum sp.]|jgi:hypothetical protein|uniref:hypothetical protein n=1 Tax=Agathobaculum sp. TaxID=2048138 RepID=UPI003D8AD15A
MKTIYKIAAACFAALTGAALLLWGMGYCPMGGAALVTAMCLFGMGVCVRELRQLHICEVQQAQAAQRSAWQADFFRQIENI